MKRLKCLISPAPVLVAMYFLLFGGFVFVSSQVDWDHFFTVFEIERRSWLLDHRLPLWSYQFCMGVSRLGDPQSFGLSPLFLFPLVFGSFWGAKLLVVAGAAAGFYFMRALVLELTGGHKELATSLAAMTVFAGPFLWHFHTGHVTLIEFYLFLGQLHYTLLGCRRKLAFREFVAAILLVWSMYSGGFYPLAVYLEIPLLIALLFFALVWASKRIRERNFLVSVRSLWAAIKQPLLFNGLGLLLASYKIYSIVKYQVSMPRTLPVATQETLSPFELLLAQIWPTYGQELLGEPLKFKPWGIWEYTCFSLLPLFFVTTWLVLRRGRDSGEGSRDRRAAGFIVLFMVVSLVFACGNFADFAPFSLLNKALSESLRGVGRFQYGVLLAWPLLIVFFLRATGRIGDRRLNTLCSAFLAAGILVFALFSPTLETDSVKAILGFEKREVKEMQVAVVADALTNMYAPALLGYGIINCYEPLKREARLVFPESMARRDVFKSPKPTMPEGTAFHLVSPPVDPASACARESYFTQNDVHVSPSCQVGTCLNINGDNIHNPSGLSVSPATGKYCKFK